MCINRVFFLQTRVQEEESRAQMAEARIENLRTKLEMKEDITQELRAAVVSRYALDMT